MRKLNRSTVLLISAVGSALFWVADSLAGKHPDGALLGFSGTMFAIWAATGSSSARKSEDKE